MKIGKYLLEKFKITRLLGRFAPSSISILNMFSYVYIVKQKQTKKFADLKKISWIFEI